MRHGFPYILLMCGLVLSVSCGDSKSTPSPQNNAPCKDCTTGPQQVLLAGQQEVWSHTYLESQPVRAIWPWGSGYLLQQDKAPLAFWLPDHESRPLQNMDALNDKEIVMGASLDETRLLLVTSDALWSIGPDGLSESPLNEHFKGKMPRHILPDRTQPDVVWLANDDAIYLWRDDTLSIVETTDAPTTKIRLSHGPSINGNPTIWASNDALIYAIELNDDDNGFVIHLARRDRGAQAMASSEDGLWAVSDGALLYRDAAGQWSTFTGEQRWRDVRANANAPGVWLVAEDDTVWHLQENQLTDLPQIQWSAQARVDQRGRLLVPAMDRLIRYDRRLAVDIIGLDNDSELTESTTVKLEITFPDNVKSATASVGDAMVEVDIKAGQLVLDPVAIGQGKHQLKLSLTYDNVVPRATSAQSFLVADFNVSWQTHIKPIYESSCALAKCHGEQSIHPLTQPMLWQGEFDNILVQLKQGTMPLPPFSPLTTAEIKLVEAWQAQGFKKE